MCLKHKFNLQKYKKITFKQYPVFILMKKTADNALFYTISKICAKSDNLKTDN